MEMVPNERSLVKRLEAKPFALLGVNMDRTREIQKEVEQTHQINWRSFFDGQEGPIAKQWRIGSLPTIYVLDPKGVIRFKKVREENLEKAVDTLLEELAAKKP